MSESIDLFGARVMGLARVWRGELDRRLKPLGLSEARWRALRHLARNGGELTQGNLAERLGIRGPTLVGQLDLLESDGWVERRSAPNDRRSKVVALTEDAAPLVEQIDAVIVEVRQELFDGMDEDALRTCSAVLDDLCDRLQSLSPAADTGSLRRPVPRDRVLPGGAAGHPGDTDGNKISKEVIANDRG